MPRERPRGETPCAPSHPDGAFNSHPHVVIVWLNNTHCNVLHPGVMGVIKKAHMVVCCCLKVRGLFWAGRGKGKRTYQIAWGTHTQLTLLFIYPPCFLI